jgi:hypothetical protein
MVYPSRRTLFRPGLLLCIASAQATSWMFAIHVAVGTMGVDGWWIMENPVLFNLFGRGGAAFIPVALYVAGTTDVGPWGPVGPVGPVGAVGPVGVGSVWVH